MKQTYKEIMDNIKVTPEMRRRVLDNVQARMEQQERPRSFRWRIWRFRTSWTAALCRSFPPR